jgi:hypothetical protein
MGITLFFQFSFVWYVSWITNMRPYGYWNIVSYILCTFILFNPLHLIVGSRLIDSKWTLSFKMLLCKILSVLLVLRLDKGCHQDFSLLRTIILVIHHLFQQKWFTLNVLSPHYNLPTRFKMLWNLLQPKNHLIIKILTY